MRIEKIEGENYWTVFDGPTDLLDILDEDLAGWKQAFADLVIPWTPPTKPSEQLRELVRIGKLTSLETTDEQTSWWDSHPLTDSITASRATQWHEIIEWLEGLGQ